MEMADLRRLSEAAQAQGALGTFDWALPQAWWDGFFKVMGHPPFGFVWSYPERSIFGEPFALTDEATADLTEFTRRSMAGE